MWICEGCWDSRIYEAFSTNGRVLVCCNCKHRKRCYLAIRKSRSSGA